MAQELNYTRWMYLNNLLQYVVDKGRCDELLCYMFDLKQFLQLEDLGDIEKIKARHKEICEATIKRINAKLTLTQHELRYADGHFHMVEFGKDIQVETPELKQIDFAYVQDLPERCKDDFVAGYYDSVVTKSRTLVEEGMIHLLENHNETTKSRGNLPEIFDK